jgi:taurine dioxygenase
VELRELYAAHALILVRGQHLSLDDQIRVMGYLGRVLHTPDSIGELSPGSPLGLGGAALCFHADYAFTPEPLTGISLYALDVVDGQSWTRFASGRRACAACDPALRQRADRLWALQVFGERLDRRNRLCELDPTLPRAVHPLVWREPAPGTGAPFLFAPEMTTDSIVGLAEHESEELIRSLFRVLYAPENVLEHRWRRGDLVVWNNRAVTHARGAASVSDRRTLQRVTTGARSMFQLHPELAGRYGMQVSKPEVRQ